MARFMWLPLSLSLSLSLSSSLPVSPSPSLSAAGPGCPAADEAALLQVQLGLHLAGPATLAAQCADDAHDHEMFQCDPPPPPLPPIIHLKTHKTGSETFANIIHRLGDRRNMRFMDTDDDFGGQQKDFGWPGAFPGLGHYGAPQHQYDILNSHAVFRGELMRAYIAPNPFFVTIVREPGAQAVSAYNYFLGINQTSWQEHLAPPACI